MNTLIRWTALALLALVSVAQPAQAREMRALLVGVTEYPGMASHQLQGPVNDVTRLIALLPSRGFKRDNVAVLADGVASSRALPTRANILRELDKLAADAAKGDFVLLYFAGHGSQEPADLSTAEGRASPDGRVEVFLPRDVAQLNDPGEGHFLHIPNSIVNFEVRERVDRMTAKGVFVWAIFDSCHSAAMVRGGESADSGVRTREVSPELLGISPQAMASTRAPRASAASAAPAAPQAPPVAGGGSVFFYAVQKAEGAIELPLPLGYKDSKVAGLFGFTIAQALATNTPMTYRQLGQYVLTRYEATSYSQWITPLFTGTRLDDPVFGQDALPVRQWPVAATDMTLPAGALDGLHRGALFALVANPLDDDAKAIGYAQAQRVDSASLALALVERNGRAAPTAAALGANPYARLVGDGPDDVLRVAADLSRCSVNCPLVDALKRLKAESASHPPGIQIDWVDQPAAADLLVQAAIDRVVVAPPSVLTTRCAGPAAAPERLQCERRLASSRHTLAWKPADGPAALRDELQKTLRAIGKATNLVRIATRLDAAARRSRVSVDLVRRPLPTPETPCEVRPAHDDLLTASGARLPVIHRDQRVEVRVTNNDVTAQDVTVLYVDADYGITVLYPDLGETNRLESKASKSVCLNYDGQSSGLERLLVIAVEASKHGERKDFTFLAQASIKPEERSDEDGDLALLTDAAFGSMRSSRAPVPVSSGTTAMRVFTLDITN